MGFVRHLLTDAFPMDTATSIAALLASSKACMNPLLGAQQSGAANCLAAASCEGHATSSTGARAGADAAQHSGGVGTSAAAGAAGGAAPHALKRPPGRPVGRPVKTSGEYSKSYLRVKQWRQRTKDDMAGLTAKLQQKMAQLELLTAENQMLQASWLLK